MASRGALVHPRLMERLSSVGLFPHLLTFQVRTGTRDVVGGVDPDAWTTVAGLEAVQASEATISRRPIPELREPDMTVEEIQLEIDLMGYYSAVDSSMRALQEDGQIFDIRGVSHDSLHFHTQLLVQRSVPQAVPGA